MAEIAAGIDLGTSNSKIGVFKEGKVQIIPNSIGDPSTPSIVAILDKGEAVGEETMMYKVDEKHNINQIKRLIGKNISDLKDLKDINYNIVGNNDKLQIKVNRNGKDELFTPEQIMALIIKKLIKNASEFMETSITKAVITIPAYFDYNQRSALEESGKLAGIEILGIINEPTAAALAYGLGTKENLSNSIALSLMKKDNKTLRKVLVFDLGGGTFDISILTIEKTKFIVTATLGDTHLGGIDFDNKLINYCIKDFCQKMDVNENNVKMDLNALRRLRIQCEKAKNLLSKNNKAEIKIYNFYNNLDLYVEMTRERFNEECEDFYQKIQNILDKVLIDSQFTSYEIDDVILVGGASKICKIRELLEIKFNPSKIRDKINQDEAVVIGATWKAHKLARKSKELTVLDITPSTLGVATVSKIPEEKKNGLIMSVLIPKNSNLPAKSIIKKYQTIIDNQKYFKIKVYSGEDKYVKNNRLLGEIVIDKLPPGKAKSIILIIWFKVDINGILTANAEVKSIGIKIEKEYSIYNKQNRENTAGKTLICLNNNSESKKKLDEIKDITKLIKEKSSTLNNSQDENEKINLLKELCQNCSNIINIYTALRKENDSENLYEKYLYFSKLLFNFYSQILILDKDVKNCSDILNKIKEEIPNFINDDIENIIESFNELKDKSPNKYIEIILFIVEILYKEGDRILEERKKYARYYSKKFYKKAEKIKNYINGNLKEGMEYILKNRLKEIEVNFGTKISEIDAFTCLIKDKIEKKNSEFMPGKTGVTIVHNLLKNAEDIYLMVDIFQEMADSLSQGPPSEAEAYCHANIIKINFSLFKNYDFNLYERENRRIQYILDRLEEDADDDEKPDPEWYKQLKELNKEIENKKKEIEELKNKQIQKIKNDIDEINNIYEQKIKEGKPKEFLDFILQRYPFFNYDSSKKEELQGKSLEELLKDISPRYHPDNYRNREDYNIYHEIYKLLVNIENQFIKK